MKLAQLFETYQKRLEAVGEEAEALAFVYRQLHDLDFTAFVFKMQEEVTDEDQKELETIFERLAAHEPAQYIIGSAVFLGRKFFVDQRVLIPRPETEELVQLILEQNDRPGLRVLDLGTGSGAIALSLKAARPDWQVTASDLSRDALAVAKQNATELDLDISLIESDVFEDIHDNFDIIVSNPPYIDWEDKAEVGLNVLHSEPHTALFADKAGYAIYEQIALESRDYLLEGGKIYLEIGYKQGQGVKDLFEEAYSGTKIEVLKDQFGQDRMVLVHG